MSTYYKTQAFVFKKEDRLEADRIFSVFTKDFGRLEVTGKAIRKIASKLKGGIELFGICDIEFIQGKNKKTLTDAMRVELFANAGQSTEKLEVAHQMAGAVQEFIHGVEKDETIFHLIKESFGILHAWQPRQDGVNMVSRYFFWNFMHLLGYCPEFSHCVNCSGALHPGKLFFSYKEGGLLCASCGAGNISREVISVSADVIKVIRLLLKKDWATLSRLKMSQDLEYSLDTISKDYSRYLLAHKSFE